MSWSELKEMFLEMGDYLYKKYLCLDLSQYNNFSLGAKNTLIPQIVIAFVLGGMIFTLLLYWEKKHAHTLVSALLHEECTNEESAKSAEELNIRMNCALLYHMRRPSPLSKLVFYRGQSASVSATSLNMGENGNFNESFYKSRKELLTARKKINFQSQPLYIPKELTYRADVRYGEAPRLRTTLICFFLFPIVGIIVLRAFPSVLLLADGLATFLK